MLIYTEKSRFIGLLPALRERSDRVPCGNFIGSPSPANQYTAYQLLEDLGINSVYSVHRVTLKKHIFNSAGFCEDGDIIGDDFPIVPGETYFILRDQDQSIF